MKKIHAILIAFIGILTLQTTTAQEYYLYSPDSKLTLKLNVTDNVKYAVSVNGKTIMSPAVIGCTTDFLQNMPLKILATKKGIVKNQTLYPTVKQKNRTINDNYNWLTVSLDRKSVV